MNFIRENLNSDDDFQNMRTMKVFVVIYTIVWVFIKQCGINILGMGIVSLLQY